MSHQEFLEGTKMKVSTDDQNVKKRQNHISYR